MLRQISLAWSNIKNNGRTMGLLSLDNWRGVNLWRNKNVLSTQTFLINVHKIFLSDLQYQSQQISPLNLCNFSINTLMINYYEVKKSVD